LLALAKIKISSTDLIWIFREKFSLFDDCPSSVPIAIVPSDDGWTVVTLDGRPSAHVEHTIAITENGPEVFTMVSEAVIPEPELAARN